MNSGLNKNKYIVTKSNSNPIDPEAQYFVLRIDKDPLARLALKLYAKLAIEGNYYKVDAKLGHDLEQWLLNTLDTLGGREEYELLLRHGE